MPATPFQVPASKASIAQNRFTFKLPGKAKVYSMPKLQFVKPSLIEELDGGDKMKIVRGLLDAYAPGVYDAIDDATQLQALYEGWAAASGMQVGESSASTDS